MKYLASDLDGTLIHDNCISKEDIEAIKEFKSKGNKFIISTGRELKGIKSTFDQYPELEYDYIVACNGAMIYDSKDQLISKNTIDKATAEKIYEQFKESNDVTFACGFGDGHYIVGLKENHGLKEELFSYAKQMTEDEFYSEDRQYEMLGLICRDEDAKLAEQFVPLIKEVAPDKIEVFRNQYFIDIAALNCTKGEGIKSVLEIEKANLENLITIGDSMNDVSMLCITPNGFTFNNAEDAVKEVATHYVDSVAECIKKNK